jgi:hypothetical protein
MNRNQVVDKINNILNNLENVCTNKMKAETIVAELENCGVILMPRQFSQQDNIYITKDTNKEWKN